MTGSPSDPAVRRASPTNSKDQSLSARAMILLDDDLMEARI
jgi:hypothetical protein